MVRAKPEFVYQNCVKLIGHGRAHKHSCALLIRNICSITNFLPTSLTTCLKSKIKNTFRVNLTKLWKNVFPHKCLLPDWSIKLRCKEINQKKTFFVTKISFEGISVCRKCKHYRRFINCFRIYRFYDFI